MKFKDLTAALAYMDKQGSLLENYVAKNQFEESIKIRDHIRQVFESLITPQLENSEKDILKAWLTKNSNWHRKILRENTDQRVINAVYNGIQWIANMRSNIIAHAKTISFDDIKLLYEAARELFDINQQTMAAKLREQANVLLSSFHATSSQEKSEIIEYLQEKLIRLEEGYVQLYIDKPSNYIHQIKDKENSINFCLKQINKLKNTNQEKNKKTIVGNLEELFTMIHSLYDEARKLIAFNKPEEAKLKSQEADRIKAEAKAIIICFNGPSDEKTALIDWLQKRIAWLRKRIAEGAEPIGGNKEINFAEIEMNRLGSNS